MFNNSVLFLSRKFKKGKLHIRNKFIFTIYNIHFHNNLVNLIIKIELWHVGSKGRNGVALS